ncbi:methyltransferase [Kineosporia succinea]|uniref:O-methyltransferase n=1 Tax=Kineosporia succinea TaxID=84632 RepID=A0ABT9PAD3_9ACTN|nr:methyltransferase [Kineosporia succinea]MDP9829658.1 hypothetical protein [Kineosporia succinea]
MDANRRAGVRSLADLATPMAIRVAATLGLADRLAAGPATAQRLARQVDADPDALGRLLDHLVTTGLLERDEGAYRLTALGEELQENRSRDWLDVAGAVGRGDLSFVDLLHSVRTGEPAYPVRNGRTFWEDLDHDPHLARSFDALMARHTRTDVRGLAQSLDWGALRHVVDVGGGNGTLLADLLTAHPGLRGTLVDLPGPAAQARRTFLERGLEGRADVVAGSFFDPLPAGAGAYLLSAVLHDWSDEAAVALLTGCADAAGARGRVMVVEAIGAGGEAPDTAMDLRMMVYMGGRERGLDAIAALGAKAGLGVRAVHPVPGRSFMSVVELAAA